VYIGIIRKLSITQLSRTQQHNKIKIALKISSPEDKS